MEYMQVIGATLLVSGTAIGILDAMPGDNAVKLKDYKEIEKEDVASHNDVLDLLFKVKVD